MMKNNKQKALFATNINYLRNRQKLTRKDAADLADIPLHCWNSYEEGRAEPPLSKVRAICDALKYWDLLNMLTVDLRHLPTSEVASVDAAKEAILALEQVTKISALTISKLMNQ